MLNISPDKNKKIIIVNSVSRVVLIFSLVGLIILAVIIYMVRANGRENAINLPIPPASGSSAVIFASSTPATLLIPAIGVAAKVEHLGKTASGHMAVPRSLSAVGWYRFGAIPGEIGNVVIAGHLDNAAGKPAVFFKLQDLNIGDIITVVGETGARFDYKVTGSKVVPYANPGHAVLEDIFGKTDKARLNLITCDGTWVQEKKTYTDRLIVTSELVSAIAP